MPGSPPEVVLAALRIADAVQAFRWTHDTTLYALLIVEAVLIVIGSAQLYVEWRRVRRRRRLQQQLRRS